MRLLRRILVLAALLMGGLIVAVGGTVAAVELTCRGTPGTLRTEGTAALVGDQPGYRRDRAATYFTFPQWYAVYAAEDFGNFVGRSGEGHFRYMRSIAGFWRGFCAIRTATAGRAEPTADRVRSIYTIGIGFTAGMAAKGLYEVTFGRIFEWLRGPQLTAEDRFAHAVAQDYARFRYTLPWYEYPFGERLGALWAQAPVPGESLARKWERRAVLSAEYGLKAGFAQAVRTVLDAGTGEAARTTIMMVVRGLSDADLAEEPRLTVVRKLDESNTLVEVPRHQAFSDVVVALSRKGRIVPEVAGNHTILLTAIVPEDVVPPLDVPALFAMPLFARPGWRRALFDVRLDRLVAVVEAFERRQIAIEHLYDD